MSASERARSVMERIVTASGVERLLISLSALALSILIGAVIVLGAGRMADCSAAAYRLAAPGAFVTSTLPGLVPGVVKSVLPGGLWPSQSVVAMGFCYDPVAVYDQLFLGALGDVAADPTNSQFATTLAETTVLAFSGLAVAVAFRAGVFNIGAQGQLVVGALTTAVTLLFVAPVFGGLGVLGTAVVLPLGLLLGALGGGLYGAVPGALKAYADANEVITTIMLNFVATSVALYLVNDASRFKDPESFANQTPALPEFAQFPSVLFRARDDDEQLDAAAPDEQVVVGPADAAGDARALDAATHRGHLRRPRPRSGRRARAAASRSAGPPSERTPASRRTG